jgi:hypothetical protein
VLYWLLVCLLGATILGAILMSSTSDLLLGQIPGADGAIQSRSQLWRQGSSIVRDYPFTGSGLMSYWMVNSVYGILTNDPFIAHAHNSLLQVWIEQGLLGVAALILAVAVILGWTWKALARGFAPVWGWAGLAALTIACLHGLVDVVFYVERTLPLVGLTLGFAYFLNQVPTSLGQVSENRKTANQRRFLGILVLITCVSAIIANRQLLSLWYSNLGSVIQTRMELASFDPSNAEQHGLDQIRRSGDLSAAETAFEKALAWNRSNRTAIQRLAHIQLSRGQYSEALSTIRQAWDGGYRDEITRLLYGDALVADGQLEEAAGILRGLTWAESRLLYQAWYRYWLNEDYARAADAWRTVLILDPEEADATTWLRIAEEKLK